MLCTVAQVRVFLESKARFRPSKEFCSCRFTTYRGGQVRVAPNKPICSRRNGARSVWGYAISRSSEDFCDCWPAFTTHHRPADARTEAELPRLLTGPVAVQINHERATQKIIRPHTGPSGPESQIFGGYNKTIHDCCAESSVDRDCVLVPEIFLTVEGGRRFLSRRGAQRNVGNV